MSEALLHAAQSESGGGADAMEGGLPDRASAGEKAEGGVASGAASTALAYAAATKGGGGAALALVGEEKEEEEEEAEDLSVVGLEWDSAAGVAEKVVFVIELPFSVLRALSIPSTDRRWDWRHRLLAACSPIGCGPCILFTVTFRANPADDLTRPPIIFDNLKVLIVWLDFSPNWNLNPAAGQATPWNGFTQPLSSATGGIPLVLVPLALAALLAIAMYCATNDNAPPKWYVLQVPGTTTVVQVVFVLICFIYRYISCASFSQFE